MAANTLASPRDQVRRVLRPPTARSGIPCRFRRRFRRGRLLTVAVPHFRVSLAGAQRSASSASARNAVIIATSSRRGEGSSHPSKSAFQDGQRQPATARLSPAFPDPLFAGP
jgi:hypothetical protein